MKDIKKGLLAFLAVAATIGALWFTNHTVTPGKATWEDVLAEAKAGGYRIIETEQLWQRYANSKESLLPVDTRQEWEYRTGHIKGALNFSMEPTWLSRWRKKEALEKFLGPDRDRFIVFY